MREPAFWWHKPGLASGLLSPLAGAYGAIARRRLARAGARAGVPVLCVGNFTLGGTGKTPLVMALAKMLIEGGERVFCLSRGYGGSATGPKLVDAHADHAAQVGDEALLLARVAPTIIARDRVAGAALAKAQGASIVIMDDGLQNASLVKDLTIAVIDGRRGIGNGLRVSGRPVACAAQRAARSHRCAAGRGRGAVPKPSTQRRTNCHCSMAGWRPMRPPSRN